MQIYRPYACLVTFEKITQVAKQHKKNDKSATRHLSMTFKLRGVAIDPTYIDIGRLERTAPNLMHVKWEVTSTHGTQPDTL